MRKQSIKLFLIMICLCLFSSCAGETKNSGHATSTPKPLQEQEETPAPSFPTDVPLQQKDSDRVEEMLQEMTLEEKVGQVFIVAFRKGIGGKPLQQMEGMVENAVLQFHPGGIILFSENIDSISQTSKLIKDMQALSTIPLFIAVDEEGGMVSRLNTSSRMHATKLPGNWELGKTEDPVLAYRTGELLGKELASLGFNMNFAPVADVNTNPKNPVIGKRAFGSEPEKVAVMVEAMVLGLQDQGVCSVLKHFPGHGDTSTDTHTGETVIQHDRERLDQVEFVPFQYGIRAGAAGIMTAHIQMPSITQGQLPATFSKDILTGILREDLEYPGLIITDALEMGAIRKYWKSGEAAVKAFEAGADILLMPQSFQEAYQGLLDAVRQGRIKESRLDESVRRILQTKLERGILDENTHALDPEITLGCDEHLRLAEEIRTKASAGE